MADKLNQVTGNESLRKYFNTDYMGVYAFDSGAEPVLTIKQVLHGKMTLDGGRKEEHIALDFVENKVDGLCDVKPLILNSTNQKTLERLYGKGADVLVNKLIKLYIDPAVRAVGGGTTEGIRIRPFAPKSQVVIPNCADCGEKIKESSGKSAEWMAAYTLKKYQVSLCAECATKRKQEADNAAVAENATTEENIDANNE